MSAKKANRTGGEITAVSHLTVIITVTVFSVVLIIMNRVLNWEPWTIPVIAAGLCICLGVHISGKGNPRARICGFSLFLIFEVFYYCVNIDTLFDSTALIIITVFIFASTGEKLLVAAGAAGGFCGLVMHLIVVSNNEGLKMGVSNIIRSGWQFVLILSGTLLAVKVTATWRNIEKQYQSKISELRQANVHGIIQDHRNAPSAEKSRCR